MHGALTILGIIALIGFAFGERTAVFCAKVLLVLMASGILFIGYVFFCAMRA